MDLVKLCSETKDLCVHLSWLSFEDLFLTEYADWVYLCKGDHFLFRSVVINSVEVGVWKDAELPIGSFLAQLNPILIKVIRILTKDINSFRNFHLSANQHVKTVRFLTLAVHHLILFHLNKRQLLYQSLQFRVLKWLKDWYPAEDLQFLVELTVVVMQQALIEDLKRYGEDCYDSFCCYCTRVFWLVLKKRLKVQEVLRVDFLTLVDVQFVIDYLFSKHCRLLQLQRYFFVEAMPFNLKFLRFLPQFLNQHVQIMSKAQILCFLCLFRFWLLLLTDDDRFSNKQNINSFDPFPLVDEELSISIYLHIALFYHILHNIQTQLFYEKSENSLPDEIPQNCRIFRGDTLSVFLIHNSEDMFRNLQIRLGLFLPMVEICHK